MTLHTDGFRPYESPDRNDAFDRQFVVHGHVTVDGARVKTPSKKVEADEQAAVAFDETSPLADDLHPERAEAQE